MNAGHEQNQPQASAQPDAFSWLGKLVRPKGNIDPPVLFFLLTAGCVPLVLALARIVALPETAPTTILDWGWLHSLGASLNQGFSFEWIPPADRPTALYLLLLPLGMVVISLARQTFGLRVLGFRAILIAIGFQKVGVIPSLLLLAVVITIIVTIRPSMRRIGLPVYARISVSLCITAIIMVTALLIAPIFRSELLWGVAFFPVIIVAMLAEGIAKTLAKDNAITAAWRTAWTIIVALFFAAISTIPAVRYCALHFPELMLTHLVIVVLISEYLDFRLLERWPARLTRLVDGALDWRKDRPVVVVVRNRWNRGVIGRLGNAAPAKNRKRSVQPAVDALRDEGFKVKVLEGDMSLLEELGNLIPPDPMTGRPGGLVLNMSTGVQGNGRFCQVPAMLELAGVAYSGPDPVAQANIVDRYVMLSLLRDAGVDVPRFALSTATRREIRKLNFPVSVRLRSEADVRSIRIKDRNELKQLIRESIESGNPLLLIEERISGREIRVSLIGNEILECLPLLERRSSKAKQKECPAHVDEVLADRIREVAYSAYHAAGCRDYARIDVRLVEDNQPVVIAVQWDGVLARHGSFVTSAEVAGYSYAQLMHRIVAAAASRYGTTIETAVTAPLEPTEFSKWLPDKQVGAQ